MNHKHCPAQKAPLTPGHPVAPPDPSWSRWSQSPARMREMLLPVPGSQVAQAYRKCLAISISWGPFPTSNCHLPNAELSHCEARAVRQLGGSQNQRHIFLRVPPGPKKKKKDQEPTKTKRLRMMSVLGSGKDLNSHILSHLGKLRS